MSPLNFLLVLVTEFCSISGQVFFKHAMAGDHPRRMFVALLAAGIALKAVDFFLWLGLLEKYHLSYLYPFDALNRLMLLLAAIVFLKERISRGVWFGALLITLGVTLVSTS